MSGPVPILVSGSTVTAVIQNTVVTATNATGVPFPGFGTTSPPVGTTSTPGTAPTAAHSDHVHAHGSQAAGTALHALADNTHTGFVPALAGQAGYVLTDNGDGTQAWAVGGGGGSSTIPDYAKASLPTPVAGVSQLARLDDKSRDVYASNGTRWRSVTGLDVYVMEDFGAVADGTTDCLAAWNAIMAAIPGTSGYGTQAGTNGAIIRFANGVGNVYHFSSTPVLSVPCIVEGAGGAYGAPRTLITTAPGQKIFKVAAAGGNSIVRNLGFSANDSAGNVNLNGWQATHAYSLGALVLPAYTYAIKDSWGGYVFVCTTAGTSGGSQPTWPVCNTNASRTETEGQTISDGSAVWTAVQAHGVVVNGGGCLFDNVQVSSCAGDGFHIFGDAGSSTSGSQTYFTRCSAYENFGDGFYFAGPNANICLADECQALVNGGYGFTEQSQLGGAIRSAHTRSNGQAAFAPSDGPFAVGYYMGPVEENGYLYAVSVGGSTGSTEPAWPTTTGATVTSGTVTFKCLRAYNGGAYNPRETRLDACYAEADQQAIALGVGAIWIGGTNGPGFASDSTAAGGHYIQSRTQSNSHAAISDNGDGFPVTSWVGSKNNEKRGWGLEVNNKATNTKLSGSEMSMTWATGSAAFNGWRTKVLSENGMLVSDGTEPGTVAGQIQFPNGYWIGGPNSGGGGSFQAYQGGTSDPTGGQFGDEVVRTGNGVGPARWHHMGANGWIPYGEAGAGPRRDVTNSSGSPYQMVAADHNRVITNQGGTSAKTFITLPDNSAGGYNAGQFFRAIVMVQDAHGIRISPQNPQTITVPGILTTIPPADYFESTQVGASVVLVSVNGVEWYCQALLGVWSTASGVVRVGGSTSSAKLTVSVNNSTGVDRTVYYTQGDYSAIPFATITSALASLPKSSDYRRLVKVAASGTSYAGYNASGFTGAGDVVLSFGTATPTLTGPTSGAAGAGSTSTTINLPTGSGTNWSSDTLRGLYVSVASSDADLPNIRPILSKTNTSFTFDAIPGVTSGTAFSIVKAGTSLAAGASNVGGTYTFNSSPVRTLFAAPAASLDYGLYSTGNTLIDHHGLQLKNAANYQTVYSSADLYCRLNDSYMSAGNVLVQNGSTAEFQNIASDGGYAVLQANSVLVQADMTSVTAGIPLTVKRSNSVVIGFKGYSNTAATAVLFDGCTGVLQQGAGLTGTGNSGYGAEFVNGGQYNVTGSSITGTGGDFSIDGSTSSLQTWTQLASSKAMSRYGGGTLLLGGSTSAELLCLEGLRIAGSNFDVDVAQEQHGGRVINYGYFHLAADPSFDGITAHAGGGQASATACGLGVTVFTTVASDHDSSKLNFAVIGGMLQTVSNLGAHILDVYPPSGGKIDAGTVNAPISLDPGATTVFLSRSNGTDYICL